MHRICVTGGRNYFNREKVDSVLSQAANLSNFVLISGGATGADTLAIQWAMKYFYPYEVYPADWKTHGRKAGILRNIHMLNLGIDILVAFPGGRGTAHMTSICEKKGVKIVRVNDECS